jgi:membrane protein required for colicin V production
VNTVDIAVAVVILLSGLFALMRGLVYEVLAMAGWVAALLGALWGEPRVRPYVQQHIANTTAAEVVGGVAIFLTILVVSSFITHAISRQVRKSAVSAVDRSLGFAFGLARGILAASLGFIVVHKWADPDEPAWLTEARTRPLLVFGARIIQSIVPNHIADISAQAKSVVDQAQSTQEIFDKLAAPKPKSSDQDDKKAPDYDKAAIDRLIETTNGK